MRPVKRYLFFKLNEKPNLSIANLAKIPSENLFYFETII